MPGLLHPARAISMLGPDSRRRSKRSAKSSTIPRSKPTRRRYDGAFGATCQFFSEPPFAKRHQTRVDFIVYQDS